MLSVVNEQKHHRCGVDGLVCKGWAEYLGRNHAALLQAGSIGAPHWMPLVGRQDLDHRNVRIVACHVGTRVTSPRHIAYYIALDVTYIMLSWMAAASNGQPQCQLNVFVPLTLLA